MPELITRTLVLKISGKRACFTNPAFKSERMSYLAITPPAIRGIVDNVVWRRGVIWEAERIDVLKPIQTYTQTINEIRDCPAELATALHYQAKAVVNGGTMVQTQGGVNLERNRTLRRTTLLYDVSYLVWIKGRCCSPYLTRKMEAMLIRYLRQGHCFRPQSLGMREYDAQVSLVDVLDYDGTAHVDLPQPIKVTRDLGWMVHSYEWNGSRRERVGFYRAYMNLGVITVPPEPTMVGT